MPRGVYDRATKREPAEKVTEPEAVEPPPVEVKPEPVKLAGKRVQTPEEKAELEKKARVNPTNAEAFRAYSGGRR